MRSEPSIQLDWRPDELGRSTLSWFESVKFASLHGRSNITRQKGARQLGTIAKSKLMIWVPYLGI